jgi:hypothetical protein
MFTPKIVPEEDAGPTEPQFPDEGELDLPGELTLLADRLSREAAMLAERYPADEPPALPQAEVRLAESEATQRTAAPSAADRGHAGRFFGPALAILLLISASAAVVWYGMNNGESEQTGSDHSAWSVSFRPDTSPAQVTENTPAITNPAPASLSPASFVHELTGPEMEGLLDLLEREETGDSRLSI